MPVDYHLHTFRCGHAVGTVTEMVAAARHKGLKEIGFAEHLPMYWLPEEKRNPQVSMPPAHLAIYVAEVMQARAANPDITIKLGVEADYIPGHEAKLKDVLASLPLDYVLGSVHFLGDWAFDDPACLDEYKKNDIQDLYDLYFQHVQQAASAGLFDSLAHPDLIKKFGFLPQRPLTDLYRKTVRVMKQFDICAEVNTAGWRYPCNELYPSPEFLTLCLEQGVPVTLGSDAHKPEQIGEGLDLAVDLLKKIGFRRIATFQQRKRMMINLR
ncbi:histidinol-phosphatase HisJ [Desulfotomaculum varum]